MKTRFGVGACAVLGLLWLAACGASSEGEPAGAAGSGSAGAPLGAAGSGNTAGAANGSAGAPGGGGASAGAASSGAPGVAGAAPTAGAPSTGGSGGVAAGGAGAAGAPSTGIPETKVVMYLPNWSGSYASWATKIDFTKMTHLDLAFGVIKNQNTNDWSMGASDADVKTLAAAAHAKGVKVLVSIGGASDDIYIINRYKTEANIDPLVANLYAMVNRLDLDGVDVDVERGGDMKSTGNFGKFVAKINSTFKPGKLVTAALAQYIMEAAGNDAGVKAWTNSFDFINLMIYNKNMKVYTDELNWWKTNRGVPKDKLTWGVIFDGSVNAAQVKAYTVASKADGGIMAWELSLDKSGTLWKAMQDGI